MALTKDGELATFGSSFVKPGKTYLSSIGTLSIIGFSTDSIASSDPTVKLDSAIRAAEEKFNGSYNEHPTKLEYYAQPDGSAVLVHVIQIQNNATGTWVEAHVDAHSGEVVSSVNFVSC